MTKLNKPLAAVLAIGIIFGVGMAMLDLVNATGRPPQPVPLGATIWDYEHGFTVTAVRRTRVLRASGTTLRARGEFYVIEARVDCPFGERYVWDDSNAYVAEMARSRYGDRYGIAADAQRLLDREDGRPGSHHVVLGASQRERIVFDLPLDARQPALLFADTMGLGPIADSVLALSIYHPNRFNLRYD
ncbi:MAG: hypothetical protein M3Y18_04755 [Candidatus Eremiobacteraeota bacterium]|nr:hypothetical protein [Candidatus Eremiobacteraeota bacterium]